MAERKKSILTQRKISVPASAQETSKALERKVSGIIHKDDLPISIVVDKVPKETKQKVVRIYFQLFCAFGANLLMSGLGLSFATSGFLIPKLEDPTTGFGISLEQGSWLPSILVLGTIFGSLGGALQTGKFGRRYSIMIDSATFLAATFMQSFAISFGMILASRFIQGYALGSAKVVIPIYTGEICQPEVRKYTGAFAMIFHMFGICAASILGRKDDALQSLMTLHGKNNTDQVNAEFESICRIVTKVQDTKTSDSLNDESKKKKYWKILTDERFFKPFGLLFLIFIIGLEWCGSSTITFYMVPFLKNANLPMDPYWGGVLLNVIRFVLALIGLPIMVRFKKKTVYLTCCVIVSFGTSTLATYSYLNLEDELTIKYPWTGYIPLLAIILMFGGYAFGLSTIPFMLQGELFPSHAKSFGSGLISFLQMMSLFTGAKMVPTLTNLMGTYGLFYLYSSLTLSVAFICFFIMPDTTGLSLEEIENIYENKSPEK